MLRGEPRFPIVFFRQRTVAVPAGNTRFTESGIPRGRTYNKLVGSYAERFF